VVYYPGICLEGQDLNSGHPKYEAGVLATRRRLSVSARIQTSDPYIQPHHTRRYIKKLKNHHDMGDEVLDALLLSGDLAVFLPRSAAFTSNFVSGSPVSRAFRLLFFADELEILCIKKRCRVCE
jgi:hypothetical protein